MKLFELHRDKDISGVSGTGVVAQGVVFDNGMVVVGWLGSKASVVSYRCLEDAIEVHGHGGSTRFVQVFDFDKQVITRLIDNSIQDDCEGVIGCARAAGGNIAYLAQEREKAVKLMTPTEMTR